MPDLTDLKDAFSELERRADAASTRPVGAESPHAAGHRRGRFAMVTATVVAVGAIATGGALFGRDARDDRSAPTAGSAGAAPHVKASTVTVSSRPAPRASSSTPSRSPVPGSPAELARRFETVLAGAATFSVTRTGTDAGDPAIVGRLTASGATGGFDLQIFRTAPHGKAWCDDPDRSVCTVRRLTDGSSLAVGREPLGGGGITYLVNLIHADGVEILMHLSNEGDPKGASRVLAPTPPLSTDRMVEIVTSDRW